MTLRAVKGGKPDLPSVDGVPPPSDMSAERALLLTCILAPERLDDAREVLATVGEKPFFSPAHNTVWEALCALQAAGEAIDVTTVMSWLRERNRLYGLGYGGSTTGPAWLTELIGDEATITNTAAYARIVRDTFRRRALIAAVGEVLAEAYVGKDSTQELVERAAEACHEIAQQGDEGADLEHALEGMKGVARYLQNTTAPDNALRSGIARLDAILKPDDGQLHIIAGRPGMGKSSLSRQLAINVCRAREGEPPTAAVVFSLEMTNKEIWNAIVSTEARIDNGSMRERRINQSDWTRFNAAAREIAKMSIWVDDAPGINVVQLRARIRRTRNLAHRKGARLRLVVVDHVGLMRPARKLEKGETRESVVAEISRALKVIAKEECVVLLAVAQLNRGVEHRPDKRPTIADLRDSGSLEQDADAITLVYRDEYYDKNTTQKNVAELHVAKQRGLATGKAYVRWTGECTRFDDLADGEFEAGDGNG